MLNQSDLLFVSSLVKVWHSFVDFGFVLFFCMQVACRGLLWRVLAKPYRHLVLVHPIVLSRFLWVPYEWQIPSQPRIGTHIFETILPRSWDKDEWKSVVERWRLWHLETDRGWSRFHRWVNFINFDLNFLKCRAIVAWAVVPFNQVVVIHECLMVVK